MKRFLPLLAVTLLLLTTGFVIFNLIRNNSQLLANSNPATVPSQPLPTALPTALSGFPDIEYVPIYPNASVTTATFGLSNYRHIVYEVAEPIDRVTAFYQDMLAKKGWLFLNTRGQQGRYTWTDPSGKSPWHIYLEVTTGLTLDNSKMFVDLNYGRYPDIEGGLPLYSDARQEATTHSDKEETFISEPKKVQVHMTDVTYLSNASPQAMADFYNNFMPEYGWFFHDRAKDDSASSQDGDISSPDGLYFIARYRGGNMGATIDDNLVITATLQKDGQTLIKLHIDQFELSGSGP